MTLEALRDRVGEILRRLMAPVTTSMQRAGVTPNQVTVAAAALHVVVAALIMRESLVAAGLLFLVAASMDLLDGALARATSSTTRFGAFLDSTLDRISEGLVFAAVAYVFARHGHAYDVAALVLAAVLSFLVSYARARAESLGVECRVGVMTRPERVLVLALGMLLDMLAPAVYLLVIASAVSLVQRMRVVARAVGTGTPGEQG